MQSKRANMPCSWPRASVSVMDQTGNHMVPLCDQDEIVNEAPCKPFRPRLMTEPCCLLLIAESMQCLAQGMFSIYIVVALKKNIMKGLLFERVKLHHHHYVCYSILYTYSMPGTMPNSFCQLSLILSNTPHEVSHC